MVASQSFASTEGEDYFPVRGQLVTFAPNRPTLQEVCFPIVIIDDDVAEVEERLSLVIESVTSGAVIGATNITDITITDNDGGCGKLDYLHFDLIMRTAFS